MKLMVAKQIGIERSLEVTTYSDTCGHVRYALDY